MVVERGAVGAVREFIFESTSLKAVITQGPSHLFAQVDIYPFIPVDKIVLIKWDFHK